MTWCAITFDQRVLVKKYYGLNSVDRFSGKKQRERIERWKCCLYGRVYQKFRELWAVKRHPWWEDAFTPWSIPHFSHLTDCKLSIVFVFTSVIFIQLTYVSLYSISSGVFSSWIYFHGFIYCRRDYMHMQLLLWMSLYRIYKREVRTRIFLLRPSRFVKTLSVNCNIFKPQLPTPRTLTR